MKLVQTPWPMTQAQWHEFARSIAAAAADAAHEDARRWLDDEPLSAEEEETLF